MVLSLEICLAMKGTPIQSLMLEDPTFPGGRGRNYASAWQLLNQWVLEQVLHTKSSPYTKEE